MIEPYFENRFGKLYCGDCLELFKQVPDNFIDLTVTSPPYDNLRSYKNNIDKIWNENVWKTVIESLYRVTKKGGVVVWIVGDATIKGSETGTSFKQALYFKEMGFNLHDTMIYSKPNCYAFDSRQHRYKNIFEYMFIFSKRKISKKGILIKDTPVKSAGKTFKGTKGRNKRGELRENNPVIAGDFQIRRNIWQYANDAQGLKHPAPFPEQLADDHIFSWSNEGDLVFDPFMGSGTTAKMAQKNNRHWLGFELSREYCDITVDRLKEFEKCQA